MTVRKPLISSSEVVNEKRRWTQDWYTWISDLVADLLGVENDITAIQGDITTIQGDITTIQGDITTIQGNITTIQGQITTLQAAVAGPSNQTGFSNGSNAPAGDVGEYLSSFLVSGSAINLPNNTDVQITSLTLTPGDWDLWGEVFFVRAASTIQVVTAAINTTVNSNPTVPVDGVDSEIMEGISAVGAVSLNGLRTRVNITVGTTYLLVALVIFSGGSVSGYGALRARRMR